MVSQKRVTTIELVRHGVAVSRGDWASKTEKDRPLSKKGKRQAKRLVEALTDVPAPIVALYSSPKKRCYDTIKGLAAHLDLEISQAKALDELEGPVISDGGEAWVTAAWSFGRSRAFLGKLLAGHAGERVVLCTHGDIIPALIAGLSGEFKLKIKDANCPKGGWWTLTFEGETCVKAVAHDEL